MGINDSSKMIYHIIIMIKSFTSSSTIAIHAFWVHLLFVVFFFLEIFRFQRSRDRVNAFLIISFFFVCWFFFYWLLFYLYSLLSCFIIKTVLLNHFYTLNSFINSLSPLFQISCFIESRC